MGTVDKVIPTNPPMGEMERDISIDDTTKVQLIRHPKVLVVDDEPFIQMALRSLLNKLGCIVEKAGNGKQAAEIVNSKSSLGDQYDIIFMDANMPVLNGYEATRLIKQNVRVTTPVICVSAQDSVQHIELCNEVGMDGIIPKPCDLEELKAILHKFGLLNSSADKD